MQQFTPPPRSKAEYLQGSAIQNNAFIRDTRTFYEQIVDALTNPISNSMVQVLIVVIAFTSSILLWFAPFFLLGLQSIVNSRKSIILSAPYRLPAHKYPKQTDYNQPIPGTGDRKFFKAMGSIYLGNCKITGQQCWVSQQDLLTHSLILGATGSGKTETLIGYVANVLSRGSGVMYIDAKAAPKLYVQISAIAKRLGREDDLLVINYLTGNKGVVKENKHTRKTSKLSNTNNPFAKGSADSIIQLLKAFLPSDSGANSIFSDKAEAFMQALIYALCDLRDLGGMELGSGVIFKYMELDKICELVLDNKNALTKKTREGLVNYLKAGISYDLAKKAADQNDAVIDQHGYAKSYYAKTLSSLQDVYSHIYWTVGGEVDFIDVILNNRILIVLLPSLEKSEPELSTLAKLNLFGIKNALSPGLGSTLEGNTDSVVHNLPSGGARTMMLNINDEYGYMSVKGFAIVAAQARGLGLGAVFAGQDFAGFKRGDAGEADQVWANTRLKHFMALEDIETLDKVGKMFKPVKSAMARRYNAKQGLNLAGQYDEDQGIEIADVDRIDTEDITRQLEGESHSSLKGKLTRLEAFYAEPDIESIFSKKFGEETIFVNQFVFISALVKEHIKERDKNQEETSANEPQSSSTRTMGTSGRSLSETPVFSGHNSTNNKVLSLQDNKNNKEAEKTNKQTAQMKAQVLAEKSAIQVDEAAHIDSTQIPDINHQTELSPPPIDSIPIEQNKARDAKASLARVVNRKETDVPTNNNKGINQIIEASASSDGVESDVMLKYELETKPTDSVKVIKADYIDAKNNVVPDSVKMSGSELDNILANM